MLSLVFESLRFLDILSINPIPRSVNTRAEPPYEKNGRGIPVTGMELVTTRIFIIT